MPRYDSDLTLVESQILDEIWDRKSFTVTEKHLGGQHNQQTHAGGRGSADGAVDIDTQIKEAKQAVSARMKEAKASGDYSGMSQLRRRVKDLEAAKASGGAAPTQEETAAAVAATKREMDAFDPEGMYKHDRLAVQTDVETARTFRRTLGKGENSAMGSGVRGREIARLVASPDESQIYIEKDTEDPTASLITVHNRRFWEEARFTLRSSVDGPELHVDRLDLEDTARGTGTSMVYRMVRESRKLGVTNITLTALRDPVSNGYYSWARMGFDGELPRSTRSRLEGGPFRHARYVSDLMKSREGRKWWKENGETMAMSFDPSPGSFNSTILETYIGELIGKSNG